MKKTITQFVFMEYRPDASYTREEWRPLICSVQVDENDRRLFVGPQEFTVDIPDTFNPVPAQVAAIEKAKQEALEKYQRSVAELNERLSKLLALEAA